MKAVKKTVLVVDDTADILTLMAIIFRLRGCTTYLAANGWEAIDQALKHSPDLILMDIRMPVMDGLETTRRIHDIPYLSKVPVIAFTSTPFALIVAGAQFRW
jgi:CheY-like chemotaxis protein